MGRFGFSSWTLHMASIILFSTLWGFALKEWAPAGKRTRTLIWVSIAVLMLSTVVIGYASTLDPVAVHAAWNRIEGWQLG